MGYRGGTFCASNSENFVMVWELPSFVEIDMNAEIGSYQEDFDGI
ncbi:MAG: hypothetical protein ACOY0T_15310 [Myxococcota bacterium]